MPVKHRSFPARSGFQYRYQKEKGKGGALCFRYGLPWHGACAGTSAWSLASGPAGAIRPLSCSHNFLTFVSTAATSDPTGESPAEGYEVEEGTGASLL